jgi:hypothetical protein
VAAKGTGTLIELVSATLYYNYDTAAFTVGADEDLIIEYGYGTDVSASIETAGLLDQTNDELRIAVPSIATSVDLYGARNKNLRLFNTGAGETADGGSSTLRVIVEYRVKYVGI